MSGPMPCLTAAPVAPFESGGWSGGGYRPWRHFWGDRVKGVGIVILKQGLS